MSTQKMSFSGAPGSVNSPVRFSPRMWVVLFAVCLTPSGSEAVMAGPSRGSSGTQKSGTTKSLLNRGVTAAALGLMAGAAPIAQGADGDRSVAVGQGNMHIARPPYSFDSIPFVSSAENSSMQGVGKGGAYTGLWNTDSDMSNEWKSSLLFGADSVDMIEPAEDPASYTSADESFWNINDPLQNSTGDDEAADATSDPLYVNGVDPSAFHVTEFKGVVPFSRESGDVPVNPEIDLTNVSTITVDSRAPGVDPRAPGVGKNSDSAYAKLESPPPAGPQVLLEPLRQEISTGSAVVPEQSASQQLGSIASAPLPESLAATTLKPPVDVPAILKNIQNFRAQNEQLVRKVAEHKEDINKVLRASDENSGFGILTKKQPEDVKLDAQLHKDFVRGLPTGDLKNNIENGKYGFQAKQVTTAGHFAGFTPRGFLPSERAGETQVVTAGHFNRYAQSLPRVKSSFLKRISAAAAAVAAGGVGVVGLREWMKKRAGTEAAPQEEQEQETAPVEEQAGHENQAAAVTKSRNYGFSRLYPSIKRNCAPGWKKFKNQPRREFLKKTLQKYKWLNKRA